MAASSAERFPSISGGGLGPFSGMRQSSVPSSGTLGNQVPDVAAVQVPREPLGFPRLSGLGCP